MRWPHQVHAVVTVLLLLCMTALALKAHLQALHVNQHTLLHTELLVQAQVAAPSTIKFGKCATPSAL